MPRRLLIALAGVVVVLAVAQLVLPAIAARVIRGRLGPRAQITSLTVSAFPAIELLWQHVGRIDLVMEHYAVSPAELSGQIAQSSDAATLNVAIRTLSVGVLTLHDVVVHKDDGQLSLRGRLLTSDLQRALPIIDSVVPVNGPDGELTVRGTASVFGARASVTATIAARDGRVVVAPQGLLGALATITVFNDPHLYVERVSGHAIPGGMEIAALASSR